MSQSPVSGGVAANGGYPALAFFAVHRGTRTGVFPNYAQLLAHTQGYANAHWQVFVNKAHAVEFSKTGVVPKGAVPVKPGNVNISANSPGAGVSLKRSVSAASSSGTARSGSLLAPSGSGSGSGSGRSGPGIGVPATPSPAGRPSTMSTTTTSSKPSQRTVSTLASTGNGKSVQVWTDGSCLGNGKANAAAAYAVYFGPDDPRNETGRVPGTQTNNRGEILAVIRALEIVSESVQELKVYTDSKYTIDSIGWLPGWVARGGFNKLNKPAANYAMIRYMDALVQRRGDRVKLLYVEGHQSNVGNNAADLLARTAARDIQEIPPERDWDRERIQLERKSALPVGGVPVVSKTSKITTLPEPQASPEDADSDYGYSDVGDFDSDVEGLDPSPQSNTLSTSTGATSSAGETKVTSAAGIKRSRSELGQDDTAEVPDSDVERKASKKAGKRREVECPSCRHKFPIQFQK